VIVTSEEDVVARVKDITGGEGAYAALECVGGEESQKLIQVRGGTTISRGGDRAWAGRD
jgi:threonine dehydrogenase-like Zn-dependent dehydrogenase